MVKIFFNAPMKRHFSPNVSRIFGVSLFSGALLLSTALPALSQQSKDTLRTPETTIVEISPATDSLRVATPNGTLSLWIASAKFVREERGLSLADLKTGDGVSEVRNNDFHFSMKDGSLPLTSLAPFVLERKAATGPDQIFTSTPGFAPSISAGRTEFQIGDRMFKTIYGNGPDVLGNGGATFGTVTITKPDYLAKASPFKFGEPGDGVMLAIPKPEAMTFTRSTRIQFSDIAVGQVVSADITLEPDGRAVCHLLKVVRD